MVVLCWFVLFALSLAVFADYLPTQATLFRPAPCCPMCGRRGWRVAT